MNIYFQISWRIFIFKVKNILVPLLHRASNVRVQLCFGWSNLQRCHLPSENIQIFYLFFSEYATELHLADREK